ncbi:MAG TPA: hypothetical protein V6C76_11195 [Drouetiella sp.]
MFENSDHQVSQQKFDSFANNSLAAEGWNRGGAAFGRADDMRGANLIARGILPDASNLLDSLSVAQTVSRNQGARFDAHPDATANHIQHHREHQSQTDAAAHHTQHHRVHHAHTDAATHHIQHHPMHHSHTDAATHHIQHHRVHHSHTDAATHHIQHRSEQHAQVHHHDAKHEAPSHKHEENKHQHHESHAEKLAHIRKEIEENIKAIKEKYPVGNPDRIVFIAAELGRDPERWKSPDGNGRCNVFVEAVLKEAGVKLPWTEGCATAQGMMNAMLKDKSNFDIAYKFHGENNEQFHQKYVPQNGDIIVWYKGGVEHIGIVGRTDDGRGIILTAGVHEKGPTGHRNGYALYNLDFYTNSPNYGPPSYVFRSKH